jgi:hypothetical protein
MSKGKRNRERRKRLNASLQDHERHRKKLTPPLMTLPNLKPTAWPSDTMPDFLWLAALADDLGPGAVHEALDLLDEFMPESEEPAEAEASEAGEAEVGAREAEASQAAGVPEPGASATEGNGSDEGRPTLVATILDGRLSTFSLLPGERRTEARAALRERAPWTLPDHLGHALSLYPECPAGWLYDDWRGEHAVDPEVGLPYLKGLVGPIIDPRGVRSTRLRMLALARWVKHGRFLVTADSEIPGLFSRYPDGLSEDNQRKAESFARAAWNALAPAGAASGAHEWVAYFWHQGWKISPCQPEGEMPSFEDEEGGEDAPGASVTEQARSSSATSKEAGGDGASEDEGASVYEARQGFLAAVSRFGQTLRQRQEQADLDLYDPTVDEVRLGLASRQFRLLLRMVEDPNLWAADLAPHVFRSLIDTRITTAWLLQQDDPEMFVRFKEYGVGKRKLYKLKVEELMDSEGFPDDEELKRLHRRLEAEVNVDRLEEFQTIDIGGTFSGKSMRDMAREAGLERLYDFQYQPLSTEAHGEWGSLMVRDLRPCGNPLHRYHRLGVFDTSRGRVVDMLWVNQAFVVACGGIEAIFDSYGINIADAIDRCAEEMTAAVQRSEQPSS